MKRLQDRIAVITGAGRGIGGDCPADGVSGSQNCGERFGSQHRWHGLRHDRRRGGRRNQSAGGEAVSNTDSVADVAGGERLIQTAIDAFGGMDILVNNAGILRDRTIFKMEESDWDAVLAVHLKGHYCCTRPSPTTFGRKTAPAVASLIFPAYPVCSATSAKRTTPPPRQALPASHG